jgi:peroxiredoxin
MMFQLTRLKSGTAAPGFRLMNREQKYTSLSDLRGKPVLLGFWNINCEGCLSEMDLMKALFDKYGDKMHIVSISADKYFSQMLFFINLKKDYIWTFLNIGDQSEVLVDYDVRSYPLFVIIDREGNIYRHPAGYPSSGLEKELENILKE